MKNHLSPTLSRTGLAARLPLLLALALFWPACASSDGNDLPDTKIDVAVDPRLDDVAADPDAEPGDAAVDLDADPSDGRDATDLRDAADLRDATDTPAEEAPPFTGPAFFSEYVEGGSNNKALEIYNGGTSSLMISSCYINIYPNGATSPNKVMLVGGLLAPDDVFVICHSSFVDPPRSTACDQSVGSVNHNGNDALELVCGGATKDVFGQIGFDPGDAWGSGDITTQNHTLRRKCSVTQGDTNGADVFDPAVEWDGFASDTFDGLGQHCP